MVNIIISARILTFDIPAFPVGDAVECLSQRRPATAVSIDYFRSTFGIWFLSDFCSCSL
jgi:hypothetical protein